MVNKSVWHFVGLLGLLVWTVEGWADTAVDIPDGIAAAISDPRRPAEQIKLDATRKPGLVVAFADVKSSDRVADFMPGNGYFTRILSDLVGP